MLEGTFSKAERGKWLLWRERMRSTKPPPDPDDDGELVHKPGLDNDSEEDNDGEDLEYQFGGRRKRIPPRIRFAERGRRPLD